MDNNSDNTNKSSRRTFGKQLAGALAVLSIASLATPGAGAQTGDQAKTIRAAKEDTKSSHDTPPPIVVTDGSLVVESDDQFIESGSGAGPFLYKGTGRPKISHIRVLHDNGDKLYEDLNAASANTKIDIEWINEDKNAGGHVIITGFAEFLITSDKNLGRQTVKKKRMHKYDHQGGGAKRIRIESIKITNPRGATTTFTAAPTGNGDAFLPDEFKILIWRH
jgi:hypothetical protein